MKEIKAVFQGEAEILARIISRANQPVAEAFGLNRENAPAHPSFCTPDWVETDMERGQAYYLGYLDGEPAGCVALEIPEPGPAYLNRLAVLPEAMGQGLGRALVAHAIELAREKGVHIISIGIIKENKQLWDWYAGLGFEPAGTKVFDHLPFDVLFMKKEIL